MFLRSEEREEKEIKQERLGLRGSDVLSLLVFFTMLAVLFPPTATKGKVF